MFAMLTSCMDVNLFPTNIEVNDKFYITDIPDSEEICLCCGTIDIGGECIVPKVEEVGFNNEYVIAKASLGQYYIIRYNREPYPIDTIIGPLNEEKFKIKRHDLRIDNIEFTISP